MESANYITRRRTLRNAVPDGAILIVGNQEAPRNYEDGVYPFRQDSHFLYYVGVNHAGMAALIEPDGNEVLYGHPEHPDDIIWHGPHPQLGDYAESSGFENFSPVSSLQVRLAELRQRGVAIHYLPPYRAQRKFDLAGFLGVDPLDVTQGVSRELMMAVAAQRSLKDEGEIAEIENALSVTARMYRAAMAAIEPGRTEAEIVAELQAPAISADRQQSFSPIVSVRGEVLHNTSYANTLAEGDLLVIDSGAESPLGYASDITRTLPVSGRYSQQQRDIYEVVLAAQTNAIAAAKPGVTNRELHFLAAHTIASGLKNLGLMRGDVDDAITAGAHALFFPHGLGHSLGLDPHDMEDLGDVVGYPEGEKRSSQFGLAYLRLARELEPGWVITVEPGIYFIPALIDRWRQEGLHTDFICYEELGAYQNFGGIRIEDDVLITQGGSRMLGPNIPKSVEEVESAMS